MVMQHETCSDTPHLELNSCTSILQDFCLRFSNFTVPMVQDSEITIWNITQESFAWFTYSYFVIENDL